jgi:hypothetical protein
MMIPPKICNSKINKPISRITYPDFLSEELAVKNIGYQYNSTYTADNWSLDSEKDVCYPQHTKENRSKDREMNRPSIGNSKNFLNNNKSIQEINTIDHHPNQNSKLQNNLCPIYKAVSPASELRRSKGKGLNNPSLQESYAKHPHEAGMDIRIIQELLGYSSTKTTERNTDRSSWAIEWVLCPFGGIIYDENVGVGLY